MNSDLYESSVDIDFINQVLAAVMEWKVAMDIPDHNSDKVWKIVSKAEENLYSLAVQLEQYNS